MNLEVSNVNLVMEEYDKKLSQLNRENVLLMAYCREISLELSKTKEEISILRNKIEKMNHVKGGE